MKKKSGWFSFVSALFIIYLIYTWDDISNRIKQAKVDNSTIEMTKPNEFNKISQPEIIPKWVPTWEYNHYKDKMGKGEIKTASMLSKNEFEFKFPYGGLQRAALCLRSHPRSGKDIMLSIIKGQFIHGVYDCTILVRFDDGNAQKFKATPPADHSTTLLFINNYNKFVGGMRKAKKVNIEAEIYQEGSRVFEFEVADINWSWLQNK